MKKYTKILSLAIVASLSAGCMTTAMWEDASKGNLVHSKTPIGNDSIQAFGEARQQNSQISTGSLVMMGQKHWYVLPPNISQEYLKLLRAGLPRAYVITSGKSKTSYNVMPVEILPEQGQFNSNFCLNYTATNQQENTKLRHNGFSSDGNSNYKKCFNAYGQYYRAGNINITSEYRFLNPVSVSLSQKTSQRTGSNPLQVGSAMVLTPFTLAADAIGSILLIPATIHKASMSK